MFEKWKAEVDEKLKEEKRKKLRQEKRVEENTKDEKIKKREDSQSAYDMWSVFSAFQHFIKILRIKY